MDLGTGEPPRFRQMGCVERRVDAPCADEQIDHDQRVENATRCARFFPNAVREVQSTAVTSERSISDDARRGSDLQHECSGLHRVRSRQGLRDRVEAKRCRRREIDAGASDHQGGETDRPRKAHGGSAARVGAGSATQVGRGASRRPTRPRPRRRQPSRRWPGTSPGIGTSRGPADAHAGMDRSAFGCQTPPPMRRSRQPPRTHSSGERLPRTTRRARAPATARRNTPNRRTARGRRSTSGIHGTLGEGLARVVVAIAVTARRSRAALTGGATRRSLAIACCRSASAAACAIGTSWIAASASPSTNAERDPQPVAHLRPDGRVAGGNGNRDGKRRAQNERREERHWLPRQCLERDDERHHDEAPRRRHRGQAIDGPQHPRHRRDRP